MADETESETPDTEVDRAQARRDRLRLLMDRLEGVLAEPTRRDPAKWSDEVLGVAEDLRAALVDHVAETEAPGGIFDDVMDHAPRLSVRVSQLRSDHPALLDALAQLRSTLEADSPSDETVTMARRQGLSLLGQLAEHRQLGADLLYEAYWVDVATGD